MATKGQKRKDKDRIVLKAGESQRPNGTYDYRWTGKDGKRHAVYAKSLEELREKEAQIEHDEFSGVKAEARCVTINEMFDLWCQVKRGLKNNTFENYKYMYNLFVRPNFGKKRIYDLKKTDVKRFYNHLVDERNVQASTVDTIHTVLHQVLQMAVDDRYIANNPSDGVLKELKQSHVFKTEKRRGLTKDVIPDMLRCFYDLWKYNYTLYEKKENKLNEEAHFLSLIYHHLGYDNIYANPYIKRMWTALRHDNIAKGDENLTIWHLPAEKKYLFDYMAGFLNQPVTREAYIRELRAKSHIPGWKATRYTKRFIARVWEKMNKKEL